ncbi:hypothetical protein [Olivibacter sitiensis]|uniref:hypothetical protein n=1 Tax=Olivibacter sitiensis TaxID=376470 RepID=UPI0003F8E35A|nr:hypothetical protein [Olivibacter sitiensis]
MKLILLLLFMPYSAKQDSIPKELLLYGENKQIPNVIKSNVLTALSHYPELKDANIEFVFKQKMKKSIMDAQPVFATLLKKKKNRKYRIRISALMTFTHTAIPIHQIPDSIMIGWIGHELGHIMDYEQRNFFSMVGFGISYLFSGKFIQKAERTADSFAVEHGLGYYIVETKYYILDNADLPQVYKDRIARLYLSPDDILEQVKKLEEKKEEGEL